MQTIKHFLAAYGKWIIAVLSPLGIWAVFALCALDAALMGLPLDILVSAYIYRDPHRYLLYVLLASAGSAVGSIVLYVIGYTGGEVLLRKRIAPERFEKIHSSFDKHEFWAVMFPAMLPPPTPFKAVVLAAAVFEMRFTHFLLAIFAGRCVRFLIEGYLAIRFGPQFVRLVGHVFAHHFKWVLLAAGLALAGWLMSRARNKRDRKLAEETNAAEMANPTLRSEENSSRN